MENNHSPHNHPRFVAGRDRIARLIKRLLTKNNLSHQDMEDLARWSADDDAAGEWLSKSQVSTLRNAKLPKPGPQIFLALGAINQRLGEMHLPVGQRPVRAHLPARLRHLSVEPGPWFLVNPETGQACHDGDLFRIYSSTLIVPELEGETPLPLDARGVRLACERLALLAQGWMKRKDFETIKAARLALLELYPEREPAKKAKLWDVIQQIAEFTPEEFQEGRDSLRFLVGRLQQGEALHVRAFDRWLAGS